MLEDVLVARCNKDLIRVHGCGRARLGWTANILLKIL